MSYPEILVSVVVITYNSVSTALETLESIKAQTYKNIEIIVSDDCSTDNTLEIVDKWLADNNKYFRTTKLVTTPRNAGVAINCNNGLNYANGAWIKLIAGDDLLEPFAIERYLNFINLNPNAKAIISNYTYFGPETGQVAFDPKYGKLTAKGQLIHLLIHRSPCFGPTGIANREALQSVGGYDESTPMIEDYPMSIRFHSNDIKVYLLNECLVRYRISKTSISGNEKFGDKFWDMLNICALPIIKKNRLNLILFHHKLDYILYSRRKKGLLRFKIFRYFLRSLDYYAWKSYILRD